MKIKGLFFCFFCLCLTAFAQVEVYRGVVDTSTYIKPEDTITKPPQFDQGVDDFLNYLESHFNERLVQQKQAFNVAKVQLTFYIGKDGKPDDVIYNSSANMAVASELQRIVSFMPKWTPGYLSGKKKKTLMVFYLQVQATNDLPPVKITQISQLAEYTDQTKQIKIFIVTATIMISVALWVINMVK